MGSRGSKKRIEKEYYSDFKRGKDKYSFENIEQDKKIDDFFGLNNGGETDRWMDEIGVDTTADILGYTQNDFDSINHAFRDNNTESDWYKQGMRIQAALEKFNLERNVTVHRGDNGGLIPGTYGKSVEQVLANLAKGNEFTSEGLVSTSLNKPFSRRFMYHIDVPRGKGRGAYIKHISAFKDAENEFLMKKGTKFRVKNFKTNGSGYNQVLHLYLQVID